MKSQSQSDVVVLISGGLDSSVMAALALEAGDTIHPLYVRQGFLWEQAEEIFVRRFLDSLCDDRPDRVRPLSVATFSVPDDYSSGWAHNSETIVPGSDSRPQTVYLPGRNMALLTQAATMAFGRNISRIQMGVLAGNPFPDSGPEFYEEFERLAGRAMDRTFRIERPLESLLKKELIATGARFALEHTFSCIRPRGERHCGECNKCAERSRGFFAARIRDPTDYVHPPKTKPKPVV